MTEQLEADVVIVGAGLAGLVAARQLAAAGARPLVVEARGRVGGRLLSEEIGDGKVVEIGGQWIGPTQDRIATLASGLGVATFSTYDEGREVLEMGGKRTTYSDFDRVRPELLRDLSRAISPPATRACSGEEQLSRLTSSSGSGPRRSGRAAATAA